MFIELDLCQIYAKHFALMISLNPYNNLGDRFCYDSLFTDGDTVAQRAEIE